jgi:glycosyltransferase involved in cell wall biosynthesis
MRLIYCTSLAFPSTIANRFQILAMAKELDKQLDTNFYLGVSKLDPVNKTEVRQVIENNIQKSYILAWKYLKFIKEKDIDYVYCREARLLLFIIIFNKLFIHHKINIIYEIHALPSEDKLSNAIENFLVRGVDNFIFITGSLKDIYVKKFKCSSRKVLICSDAVDLDIFNIEISTEEARKKTNLPQNVKLLGYCGKFTTMGNDKGIDVILQSLQRLPSDVLFIAVGAKPKELEYYKKLARQYGVEKKVRFFIHVDQEKLALYQKAFDVLLMPFPHTKHYAYYMSPLKMFEYMASQRPIIASNLPSVREILNENNSLLVKPGDQEDLAQGIKEILNNKELSDKISKQAFSDVQQYTWEKRVERILDFIK